MYIMYMCDLKNVMTNEIARIDDFILFIYSYFEWTKSEMCNRVL
jgi:hypothetical protein